MNTPYQALRFSDIKEKLPSDCWVYRVNEGKSNEFNDATVLYFHGDALLPSLQLDYPFLFAEEENNEDYPDIFIILVEGNLTVEQYIFNEETDGAVGLIVLGNLTVSNMIVGGQEVYVAGNLEVKELFWGDYNHGDLTVAGDVNASVFIDTEQYHVKIKGEKNFNTHISDFDATGFWTGLEEKIVSWHIQSDCFSLNDDGDDEVYLSREQMHTSLKEEKPIIIKENIGKPIPPRQFPILFPTDEINIDNLSRLAHSSLMKASNDEKTVFKFSFQLKDIFFRVTKAINASQETVYIGVYLEKVDQYALLIEAKKPEEEKQNTWQKLFGKTAQPNNDALTITKKGRYVLEHLNEEQKQWYYIDETTPEHFLLLLKYGWQQLLISVSQYEYYQKQITPNDIQQILALPIVEPYNDFYDDDKNGFWAGNIYTAFRQEGALFEDKPQPPLLKIAKQRITPENETVVEYYLLILTDNNQQVFIKYNPDEDNGSSKEVAFNDVAILESAHNLFFRAVRQLTRLNDDLLKGTPPYNAEDFAMEHWKEKGYIK